MAVPYTPYEEFVPPELWGPDMIDAFIRWVKENLPGKHNRPARDYMLKRWYQANKLPYDGYKFKDILVE